MPNHMSKSECNGEIVGENINTRFFQLHSAKYPCSLCIAFLVCRACKYCRPRSLCICFLPCRACKYRCPRSLCICFFVCRACKCCRPNRFFAYRACKRCCPCSLCIGFFVCRACNNRLSVRCCCCCHFHREGCCLPQEFATALALALTTAQSANQRLLQLHVGGGLRAHVRSCEAWRGPEIKWMLASMIV